MARYRSQTLELMCAAIIVEIQHVMAQLGQPRTAQNPTVLCSASLEHRNPCLSIIGFDSKSNRKQSTTRFEQRQHKGKLLNLKSMQISTHNYVMHDGVHQTQLAHARG